MTCSFLYSVGVEDESMDQEEPPNQDEAISLATLWGKLRHWAG